MRCINCGYPDAEMMLDGVIVCRRCGYRDAHENEHYARYVLGRQPVGGAGLAPTPNAPEAPTGEKSPVGSTPPSDPPQNLEGEVLDGMTVDELRDYAAAIGVDLVGVSRKAEIIERIESAFE